MALNKMASSFPVSFGSNKTKQKAETSGNKKGFSVSFGSNKTDQ